jgi:alpha-ribazole phosphatase
MSIILIRHTKPLIPEGLCYGHSDVPYEEEGFAAWHNPDPWPSRMRVYSSPLKRCHDLAIKAVDVPICIDARLKEMHFGRWENRLWSELPRHETELWTSNYLREAPPEGESLRQLCARLQDFFSELKRGEDKSRKLKNDEEAHTHIVFSHAGVIRLLLIASYREGLDQYFVRQVDYGSIFYLPRCPEDEDFERILSEI